MGSGAWIRLLLVLTVIWGIRARKTQLGILGEPTLLQIPHEFQERTQEFGEASWKKTMEGLQKKKTLLRFSGGNLTQYEQERMRFHRGNFSLEILNTSREDEQLYEFSVSKGPEEELWHIQLQVLEAVSDPRIRILHRESSNGSCSLSLLCSSERGDKVSYSWDSWDIWDSGICSGNGSVLNVSYSLRSAGLRCVCTAWNRVSRRHAAFDLSGCGAEETGVPGVRTELLVPLVALGVIVIVIVIVIVVIVPLRARRDQEPCQVTPDGATSVTSATIYAQVQKPKVTVPSAAPRSCTTIYAAATGPPSVTGPPTEPPALQGHPQEATTVYASVTMPMA